MEKTDVIYSQGLACPQNVKTLTAIKASPATRALNRLFESMNVLESSVKEIETRLDKCLTTQMEGKASPETPISATQSPLTNEINRTADRIYKINSVIRELLERIEL